VSSQKKINQSQLKTDTKKFLDKRQSGLDAWATQPPLWTASARNPFVIITNKRSYHIPQFFEFLIPLFFFLEIHPFSMQLKWFQRSNPNPEKYFKVIRSDSSHNKSQQAPHYDTWMHRHSDAVFQKQRAPKKISKLRKRERNSA